MVHAGYFGEDRGSGEEAVQAEVNDILKNKEKMLSFKNLMVMDYKKILILKMDTKRRLG